MWLIKACLMFVIIIQFMQHSECRRRGGKRHNALSPHLRFRELTKSKGSRALQVQCKGNRKNCVGKRLRPRKRCKRLSRKCRRRRKKRCYRNQTCLKRLMKVCQKKVRRCKNTIPAREPTTRPTSTNLRRGPAQTVPTISSPPKKGLREECQRPDDCERGHCCARHGRKMVCKELVQQANVCTKHFNKRSPEMYQRCPCAPGLHCAPSEHRHHTCQIVT